MKLPCPRFSGDPFTDTKSGAFFAFMAALLLGNARFDLPRHMYTPDFVLGIQLSV